MTTTLPEEGFTFLDWSWDVTAARALTEGRAVQQADITQAPTMLVRLDEDHWPTVDLTDPIIVGWTPDFGGGDRATLPLDGWHRIRKAQHEGLTTLPALLLTPEESDACLLARPRRTRRPRRAR